MKDKSNLKFGRWTILRFSYRNKTGAQLWLCRCDCGKERDVQVFHVMSGISKSCGCWRRDSIKERITKHGMSLTPEYSSWHAMINRCFNKNDKSYKSYADRGITVCKRWLKFENFYLDMKSKPSKKHTLERINNNKGYSPKNCRWATRQEQASNTRRTRLLTYKNKTLTAKQWAEEVKIKYPTLLSRLRMGWSIERALTKNHDA